MLFRGINGKVDQQGKITDSRTISALASIMAAFKELASLPGTEHTENEYFDWFDLLFRILLLQLTNRPLSTSL